MLVYIKPLSIFPKLHSDTLFGALISAINELYPEKIGEILTEFRENPPFLISSPFPYFFNCNDKIRFYPKIISNDESEVEKQIDSEKLSNRKKFKKIQYIEEDLFFRMLNGKLKESSIIRDLNKYKITGNLLYESNVKILGKYKDTIIPNNKINRITQETEPFYSEGYEFSNMGLFFLVEFKDEEYKIIVKTAIKFLKDRGFGKDISIGKGHFDFEIDENYSLPNFKGNYFVTLSRFIPNDVDLSKITEYSSYEIDSKRGKSKEGELRKQVRFFKEGSTFPDYKELHGRIVDSGNKYPAIEYGYAFPIKYNWEEV